MNRAGHPLQRLTQSSDTSNQQSSRLPRKQDNNSVPDDMLLASYLAWKYLPSSAVIFPVALHEYLSELTYPWHDAQCENVALRMTCLMSIEALDWRGD